MAREFRIGHGFDVHRFRRGRKLVLGGIEIPHPKGLIGHSDADVLLHALINALLGAMGESDIG
ncbi:MAG TPA: 2-C-methyl-D-erythritol 2,4-cyclodiphosphate synthase, partial [Candidatus Udaeobacter sp.]|nr:2-C-methyl-D-erythritol 2,4-cyclodiphosphate synthase [Candidatus Udaeobacter sp.]